MQVVKRVNHEQDRDLASWEASVSAWIDGETDAAPDSLDTPYGRQVWDTYHLIGDVLRNPDLAIKPSDFFYARVSKAIDAEPHVLAPRATHRQRLLRKGLSGLAVAAAVASVAWVAIPNFSNPDASAPAPTEVMASVDAADDGVLRDYLDAHRDVTGLGPIQQVSFEARAQR
jgi:sigma-E factor negative regulatory protein RseA